MAKTWIGISGWTYDGWRGRFYPTDLPRKRQLEYASERFNSIEINGSFYSLQLPSSYREWHAQTPDRFLFAVKGSRFITHNKKLADVETALANFLASGVLLLNEKLGPFLWQLPPHFRYRADRLERFFELLPRTTHEAARLAKKHDERLEGREWTEAPKDRNIRHAIEPRHESFFVPEFSRLCRRHGIAIVASDSADWPYTEEVTAGFLYLRLHGSRRTYESGYTDAELDRWAERIRLWRDGGQSADARVISSLKPPARKSRDVFVYFDNDAKVQAPKDAMRLADRLLEK